MIDSKEHDGLDSVSFVETIESRRRRGKMSPAPAEGDQAELHARALREWEQQGYLIDGKNKEGVPSTNL